MKMTYEKYLIEKAVLKHIPLNASLELLPLCNMNCDMCYVRLSNEEMENLGRLRTADEWLTLAKQMQEAGTLFILLTGGEPLLYPEFKKVYMGLRKMGMILTVNTNGTLINEKWADFFAENLPRRINITLYGTTEETYEKLCHYSDGFQRTLQGIRLLRERNIDVKINGSLVKANKNDIKKIVKIANELGAGVNIDTYMYPAVRERNRPFNVQSRLLPEEAAKGHLIFLKEQMGEEAYRIMAEEKVRSMEQMEADTEDLREMRCQAGRSSFTVNWQGYMRPCVMLTEPSFPIFTMDFKTAWKQLGEQTEEIRISSRCSRCKFRTACQTCAACAFLETGSYKGVPEYMCRYTEETLRLLQEYLQENPEAEKNG